ncbi:CsxC family protein [Clostridium novyi]|uniref:CsxC family protein n=1 Tax=Clostridium novyi TaxID=1542 RepID=UPI00068F5C4C|nr:hypothetical protein [Clostridium novyi]
MDIKEQTSQNNGQDSKGRFCGSVKSKTLPLCDGTDITPSGINGPLVAKIPVVLGEKDIQIDVEADIKLKEDYYEIKRVKKDIYLTQCKLLPRSGIIVDDVPESGKLFLSGYVRKNIEYATADCVNKKDEGCGCMSKGDVVSGRINHTTVDTPFTCVTEVEYDVAPQVTPRGIQREIDYFSDNVTDTTKHGCKVLGKHQCQQDFEDLIDYTEQPYCEIEQARIFEADLHREPMKYDSTVVYNKLIEKMVVYLRVKVLQIQQVNINGTTGTTGC